MYVGRPNVVDCLLIIIGLEQCLGRIKEMQEGLMPNDSFLCPRS